MRRTIALAKATAWRSARIRAFPISPGSAGARCSSTPHEVEDSCCIKWRRIAGIAAAQGVRLQHVKAHGALYNMAAARRDWRDAIARAVAAFDRSLILFGLPDSELLSEGERPASTVAAEIFADRTYEAGRSLASRRKPGSVIHDPTPSSSAPCGWRATAKSSATSGVAIAARAPTRCACTATHQGSADLAPPHPCGARSGGRCVIAPLVDNSVIVTTKR